MQQWHSSILETIDHRSATWLAILTAILVGGLAPACTEEQTIEDDEPTAEQPAEQPESVEFEEVLDEPDEYRGQWVRGEVTIDSLISDKAFFISGDEGNRMFAVFHLEGESEVELEPGQRVRLEGQIVGMGEAFERLRQLDEPAPEQLEDESFALLISEADDVEILAQPPQAEQEEPEAGEEQAMTDVGRRDYGSLENWDVDGDGTVVREEFDKGIADQRLYSELDTDNDGELAKEEFQQWVFGFWDMDADGNLTEEEFEERADTWDQYEWGEFEEWNTDDDEMLTDTEFTAGATEIGVFDEWDADDDDAISEDEFAGGLFDIWDGDDDGELDSDEWGFEEQPDRQARAEQAGAEGDQTPVTLDDKDYGTFGDWDADDDQALTRQEFRRGVEKQGVFGDLDANDDDRVSQDEFRTWVFGVWDANNDGNLTEEEYEAGTEQFDDYEWGDFEEWNADDDQMLTDSEFMGGEAETDLFDEWDADDSDFVDQEEFSDGLFDVWDDDEDDELLPDDLGFEEAEREVSVR